LPAAALATSYPATWLEQLGSTIHRMGMYAILVGGILMIIAMRIEQLDETTSRHHTDHHR